MIYLDEPEFLESDAQAVAMAVRRGQVSTAHDITRQFEKAAAEYLGVDDCVATNSGTSALHLALLASGIGPGDTVIVPALTFVGTANAVLYITKKIKIIDVPLDYWVIPVSKKTVSVCLYGSFYSGGINCNENDNFVLDFAENFDSLGAANHLTKCYSFNGNKFITGGAGGLITGPKVDFVKERLRPSKSSFLGYNYRMPSLNAALAIEQLKRIDSVLKKKRAFYEIYRNELNGVVSFQKFHEKATPWLVAAIFDSEVNVETLCMALKSMGIATRRIFKPLNHYPYLQDGKTYPNAEYIYKHGLCLPSSTRNSIDDIYKVCKAIKELV